MKILNAAQFALWDQYTVEQEPVASIDLMERAARKCSDFLETQDFISQPIKIICGKGNNGGDGLAIARQLLEGGISPEIFIVEFGALGTSDFQQNLHRLHPLTTRINFIQSAEFFPRIQKDDLVIDALFGAGLNRPLEGLYGLLVEHINASGARVVAIDIPSGLFIDRSSQGNKVIRADITLTFQTLKRCFLVAENAPCCGTVRVLDIGLNSRFPETVAADLCLTTRTAISRCPKKRNQFSHKGTYGHALLLAGSRGKMGAAVLCTGACLRTGIGLLTVQLPEIYFPVLHISHPEAMVCAREDPADFAGYSSIGIGPGLGTDSRMLGLLEKVIREYRKPLVIDADALSLLSQNKNLLKLLPENSILTPHPREFDRLFGNSADDFVRQDKALAVSREFPVVVVLKGHYTLVAFQGKGYLNTTGNAGMAKGGSGDVLTGILTALLGQGHNGLDAAKLGVYLHGLAADLLLSTESMESLLPSDLIANLGQAFRCLEEPDGIPGTEPDL